MSKPTKETIAKRIATRRRNAAKRRRLREGRPLDGPTAAAVRLDKDGCSGKDATRRRIMWLAHERKLPPCEIEKALTLQAHHIAEFVERHNLSFDWLFCGDLKGLLRMPRIKGPTIFTAADLIICYNRLGVSQRIRATKILGNMVPNEVWSDGGDGRGASVPRFTAVRQSMPRQQLIDLSA